MAFFLKWLGGFLFTGVTLRVSPPPESGIVVTRLEFSQQMSSAFVNKGMI